MNKEQITDHLHPSERTTKRNAQEEAMIKAALMRNRKYKQGSKLTKAMKAAAFAGLSSTTPLGQAWSTTSVPRLFSSYDMGNAFHDPVGMKVVTLATLEEVLPTSTFQHTLQQLMEALTSPVVVGRRILMV